MKNYDVVIIGAGPAGAFLGMMLSKSMKILIIDGAVRGKTCGGLLSPDTQKCLARFDFTLPKDVLVDPQIFSVRTMDLNTSYERWYQRMYINVDRKYKNPFYSCIFDRETSDCCSWIICKDNHLMFGGAFALEDCRKKFELQKEKLHRFDIYLNNPIKTEACMVLRPNGVKSFFHGKDNIFLIGEAAGFISPSSLEGISYAIRSAEALSKSINNSSSDKDILFNYAKKTILMRLKILAKNLKCPFMYNHFLRNFVLKTGITAFK